MFKLNFREVKDGFDKQNGTLEEKVLRFVQTVALKEIWMIILEKRLRALIVAQGWMVQICGKVVAMSEYDDYCYECAAYGDDYFINDEGELECYCPKCAFWDNDDDEWDD